MKPLYIKLSKKPPVNYLRLSAGIIMTVGSVYIYFNSSLTLLKPYQTVLFFLFGIYYAVMGAGLNLLSPFAKTFIALTDDSLCLKQRAFSKQKEVRWSEINEIQMNITAIRIKLKDNTEFQFEYRYLDDEAVYTLRTALIHQAKTNHISIG